MSVSPDKVQSLPQLTVRLTSTWQTGGRSTPLHIKLYFTDDSVTVSLFVRAEHTPLLGVSAFLSISPRWQCQPFCIDHFRECQPFCIYCPAESIKFSVYIALMTVSAFLCIALLRVSAFCIYRPAESVSLSVYIALLSVSALLSISACWQCQPFCV